MDAFSAGWFFFIVRDIVDVWGVDGECHVGKRETVCWSMESVRMCRMCSCRAERVVRFVGVGRAARGVDAGEEACSVRV